MPKKVIISESMMKKIVTESIISEAELSKDDVAKIVRDSVRNDKDLNKDIEKKVKKLVAQTVNTLFRTLWQRQNFYVDEIQK